MDISHLNHLAEINFSSGHVIAIVATVSGITLAGVVAVSAMYFQNRRREMWHETARIALEKGQPVPPMDPSLLEEEAEEAREKAGEGNHDVRGGLVLIAVGAGLWLMLGAIAPALRFVGAIPGFIGVALLVYALCAAVFSRKNPGTGNDTTTRS